MSFIGIKAIDKMVSKHFKQVFDGKNTFTRKQVEESRKVFQTRAREILQRKEEQATALLTRADELDKQAADFENEYLARKSLMSQTERQVLMDKIFCLQENAEQCRKEALEIFP